MTDNIYSPYPLRVIDRYGNKLFELNQDEFLSIFKSYNEILKKKIKN